MSRKTVLSSMVSSGKVFAGRTGHFVSFVVLRLISALLRFKRVTHPNQENDSGQVLCRQCISTIFVSV